MPSAARAISVALVSLHARNLLGHSEETQYSSVKREIADNDDASVWYYHVLIVITTTFDRGIATLPSPILFRPKMSVNAKPPNTTTKTTFLFEGNETRRVGGTDTGTTVLDRLAGET